MLCTIWVVNTEYPDTPAFLPPTHPLLPLRRGGTRALKVPLLKGDLGGSPGQENTP